MLSLFVFAPVWGRLSDRFGRRTILLIGLIGFSAVTFIFAFIETLPSIYAERILSGLFAVAATPVALATIGDLGLTQVQIALMFTTCSLVMIVMQAIIFFSLWVKPATTRWFIAPALGVLRFMPGVCCARTPYYRQVHRLNYIRTSWLGLLALGR